MLVVLIVHVCFCTAKCAPEAVCRYQDFVDEGCARRSAQVDLPVGEATNRMGPVHIRMALITGKKEVCCACDFSVGIKAQLRRKADATAARLRASQRTGATTKPHLRMVLETCIQKNRCVHVPLFCRYQEFVEQQEDPDPQVENGCIMGSASLNGAEDRQKTGVFCLPLFCRYQGFVEQHQDPNPQVDNGRIMGTASLDGAEDGQKSGVLCMPLFCRPLGILHL